MEKLKVRKSKTGTLYVFWCPGCEQTHTFDVRSDGGEPTWTFDGNMEHPTFAPSLQYGNCHLMLRGGIIEYLPDCRHKYRGRDIPLEEF